MRKKTDVTIDVYRASLTPDALMSLRRKLAKRANQRLVRLERATSRITGESYNEIGAAPLAYDYLSRQDRRRFSERLDPGQSYESLKREVTVLQGFLTSKSSTVSGIRSIEESRIRTFESGKWGSYDVTGKKRRGLKFSSTKEFYEFLQSGTFRELLQSGFSSEQIIESYDEAVETYAGKQEEALNALSEALDTFRAKGRGSLKELRAAAGGKRLT